ncbi:MAG: AmmeMemoRadiSam system protein A [Candidatus Bilamarchaeaceae archaeon]
MPEAPLTKQEKTYLLKLARKTIEYVFQTGEEYFPSPAEVPTRRIVEDGAVFVTLWIKNAKKKILRGCIGTLEAHRPLFQDLVDNAISAAFRDPRFLPLKPQELKNVVIGISYLTKPEEVKVKGWKDLTVKLNPGKTGLIIQKGLARATYLPAVWEELQDKEAFMRNLCMKAGLEADEWKEPGMRFFFYEADEFEE